MFCCASRNAWPRSERFDVAVLLIAPPHLEIQLRVAFAHLLRGRFRLLLEPGLASVQKVEPARDLAGHLDVRDLILADGHVPGAVNEDVGRLQQRVPEKAVRGEIAFLQLLLLILVARHAFEPAVRRDHRQQQMQLRMLRHARLNEDRRLAGIDAHRQPVDCDVEHARCNRGRILVLRRQRVPVRDEEEAIVLVLQRDPVLQNAVVMTEVQLARRAHSGQDALVRNRAHARAFPAPPARTDAVRHGPTLGAGSGAELGFKCARNAIRPGLGGGADRMSAFDRKARSTSVAS